MKRKKILVFISVLLAAVMVFSQVALADGEDSVSDIPEIVMDESSEIAEETLQELSEETPGDKTDNETTSENIMPEQTDEQGQEEKAEPLKSVLTAPVLAAVPSYTVSLGVSFAGKEVSVDGAPYICDASGNISLKDGSAKVLQVYTFNKTEGDPHGIYPTSMKVYMLSYADGKYSVKYMPEFDNIMQYRGISIKFTDPKGVRILTGVPTDRRETLIGAGINGYTLNEYGTLLMFKSDVTDSNPFRFGSDRLVSGSAYRKSDGYNKIFMVSDGLTQYTNPLLFSSSEVCSKELVLRSYMKLNGPGGEVVLYGGIINRTIKHIAENNIAKYLVTSGEYRYLASITGDDIRTASGKLIGHMGQKALAPGNTAASYNLAVQNGMWGIECDLRSTKDGTLICVHEETADICTNGTGAWQNLDYSYVKNLVIIKDPKDQSLVAKYPNQKVGTFEEYLDICKNSGCVALIDMKWVSNPDRTIKAMIDMASSKGMLSRCIFQCSIQSYLQKVRQLYPQATMWYLKSTLDSININDAVNLGCVGINVESCSAESVNAAHSAGLKVSLQTLTSTSEKNTYFGRGADFALCNRPI